MSSAVVDPLEGRLTRNAPLTCYTVPNGGQTYYRHEHIYYDLGKPNSPYGIAVISAFRQYRDGVHADLRIFKRLSDLPGKVVNDFTLQRSAGNEHPLLLARLDKPEMKAREIFLTDIVDSFPACCIVGRCRVHCFKSLQEITSFDSLPNQFFYILSYNPHTKEFVSTLGEVRVGEKYQAVLPAFSATKRSNTRKRSAAAESRESPLFLGLQCPLSAPEMDTYLDAARGIISVVSLDAKMSNEPHAISIHHSDDAMNLALSKLHQADYDQMQALKKLSNSKQVPKALGKNFDVADTCWTDEDRSCFGRGYKVNEKAFARIQRDFLPHKTAKRIVKFYYQWKKTPVSLGTRNKQAIRTAPRPSRAGSVRAATKRMRTAIEKGLNDDNLGDRPKVCYACGFVDLEGREEWTPGAIVGSALLSQCAKPPSSSEDEQQTSSSTSTRITLLCKQCYLSFRKYGSFSLHDEPRKVVEKSEEEEEEEEKVESTASESTADPPPPPRYVHEELDGCGLVRFVDRGCAQDTCSRTDVFYEPRPGASPPHHQILHPRPMTGPPPPPPPPPPPGNLDYSKCAAWADLMMYRAAAAVVAAGSLPPPSPHMMQPPGGGGGFPFNQQPPHHFQPFPSPPQQNPAALYYLRMAQQQMQQQQQQPPHMAAVADTPALRHLSDLAYRGGGMMPQQMMMQQPPRPFSFLLQPPPPPDNPRPTFHHQPPPPYDPMSMLTAAANPNRTSTQQHNHVHAHSHTHLHLNDQQQQQPTNMFDAAAIMRERELLMRIAGLAPNADPFAIAQAAAALARVNNNSEGVGDEQLIRSLIESRFIQQRTFADPAQQQQQSRIPALPAPPNNQQPSIDEQNRR